MTVTSFLSPIGWISIQSENEKLVSVLFSNEKPKETPQQDSIALETVKQLQEYFDKKRTHFDLPLNPQGTSFQKKVWKQLALIPCGETISYQEIAQSMGTPKASRAIGYANSKNPFVIIIPCHRVIHADGSIGGYNSGTERKKWLLDHESTLNDSMFFKEQKSD
ncbi:MAG: methylated-DNA--[protein]-cysteine S-methyltransferase [Microbacter sp.]